MFEIHAIAEHEAIVRRELQFVVVAEPMEFRPPRNLAHGRERTRLRAQHASRSEETAGCCGGHAGLQELTSIDSARVAVYHQKLLRMPFDGVVQHGVRA